MADRPEINEDFADMLLCLQGASVEFILVGAHALAAHGIARATGDIDIFVRPSPANADRVVQALVDFGVPIAAHNIQTRTGPLADKSNKAFPTQTALPGS